MNTVQQDSSLHEYCFDELHMPSVPTEFRGALIEFDEATHQNEDATMTRDRDQKTERTRKIGRIEPRGQDEDSLSRERRRKEGAWGEEEKRGRRKRTKEEVSQERRKKREEARERTKMGREQRMQGENERQKIQEEEDKEKRREKNEDRRYLPQYDLLNGWHHSCNQAASNISEEIINGIQKFILDYQTASTTSDAARPT
ncbi:UPF0329 protein ECU05_1680/ECU11_0050-like [Nylanderia fulva]|uniref:UPF0329 protein ECU05_1680/ECU11_0050-like n=1 Tax=Nylanderia fulva TaxID=613905 RepID=UPI0010FB1597|nr:UPF0329 protein ECU05_1680/ECU11_0050-like [Nylanderia fulva]